MVLGHVFIRRSLQPTWLIEGHTIQGEHYAFRHAIHHDTLFMMGTRHEARAQTSSGRAAMSRQSGSQAVRQSGNWAVQQWVSRPVQQYGSATVGLLGSQLVRQPIITVVGQSGSSRAVTQPSSRAKWQSSSRSVEQMGRQEVVQLVSWSVTIGFWELPVSRLDGQSRPSGEPFPLGAVHSWEPIKAREVELTARWKVSKR